MNMGDSGGRGAGEGEAESSLDEDEGESRFRGELGPESADCTCGKGVGFHAQTLRAPG